MTKTSLSKRFKDRPDWLRFRIQLCFTKPVLFIWGLVLSHSIVEYATMCVLMLYLANNVMGKKLMAPAIVINVLDGLSGALVFLAACVADAYTDSFNVIVFSTGSYAMGLILLWITACSSQDNNMVYVAVILLALGKSCRGSTLQSFLDYRLRERRDIVEINGEDQNTENIREEPQRDVSKRIWWHSAWIWGYVIALWGLGNATWLKTLKISALVMGVTCMLFYSGFFCYHYEDKGPTRRSHGSILRDLKPAATNKQLLLWAIFFAYSLVLPTGNTLFIAPIFSMNLHVGHNFMVPISSFFVLKSLISDIVVFLFWLASATERGTTLVRIGAGMSCAVFSCLMAWQVELHRLNLIRKEGIVEDPSKTIPISMLWLTPQYCMLGLMEGLAGGGLLTYANSHLLESVGSYAEPLSELVLYTGKFGSIFFVLIWGHLLDQGINNNQLHKYFLMLAILSYVFLCLYLCWFILNYANLETNVGNEESESKIVALQNQEVQQGLHVDEESQEAPEENLKTHVQESGKILLRLRSRKFEREDQN